MHWLVVMQPFVSYQNQLAHQGRPNTTRPEGSPAPVATSFADDNQALVLDPGGCF